ncbi:helical backbone metal receptor [Ornithinimicrobium tianjinense]|uniref:ABC transporter substrate-binding protein n=1 Tax=Ornithinimicrobium tianjinense TaxID=1195761 RepID=A0A917F2Y0_9MICO|nr:helical backbone metal receptor [Ornithinimicrobium tianjinense]GGF45489.1 ABC transporter substrate-binding protein [Ornithinimicrobium tianjinense]
MTPDRRLVRDDLGAEVPLPAGAVTRVVSLVPSLTEALAATRPEALVGATDWCTRPEGLDIPRVRGTKNPDRAAVADLRPELVVCVQEENRELDVRRLREAGVPVWVGRVESVDDALRVLRTLIVEVLAWAEPAWLLEVERLWAGPAAPARARVAVPIWRDPWMVVGSSTFTADLLARAGLVNVFGDHRERYPHVDIEEIDGAGADVVLLPDEPYVFTPQDGPEAFARTRTALVSGRLLTWYGPAMVEARASLDALAR